MNGKLINKIIDPISAIGTVCCGILTSIGVSFFSILMISGLFLRVPNEIRVSKREVIEDYYRLVGYLLSYSSKNFTFHFLPTSTSASEHFRDVRGLIHIGIYLTIIVLILFIILFKQKKKRKQLWELLPLFQESMLLLVVITTLITISFNDSFLWFHYHFFQNTLWIFNPQNDPIILVLDDRFFLTFFIFWNISMLLLILVVYMYIKNLIKLFVGTSKS